MQQDSDDLGELSEVGGGCSAPRGSVGALGPSANLLQSHKAPFPAPTPGPLVVVCSSSLRAGCVGHSGEWRRVVGRRRHTYTHTHTHTPEPFQGAAACLPALGFLCYPTGQPMGWARPGAGRSTPQVIGKLKPSRAMGLRGGRLGLTSSSLAGPANTWGCLPGTGALPISDASGQGGTGGLWGGNGSSV